MVMKKSRFLAIITILVILLNALLNIGHNVKALNLGNDNVKDITNNELTKEENQLENSENNTNLNEIINNTTNKTANSAINESNNENTESVNNIIENNATLNNSDLGNNTYEDNIQVLENSSEDSNKIETLGVEYRTHVENLGWQDYVKNGEVAGTQGKCYRLEALNIRLIGNNDNNLKIDYQVHVQDMGWQNWKKDDEMAGTQGNALRLEAIKIKLEHSENYSIMYRVHVQEIGWQDWKTDGEIAGTQGKCLRLEAIQIKIVPKVKKGKMYIDTPTNDYTYYNLNTIKISGWKMSNVSNTKIRAYIDNNYQVVEDKLITYKERKDVIKSVEGFGTEIENPNPGFEFSIDPSEMSEGKHKIYIEVYTSDNTVLVKDSVTFNIDNSLHVQYRSHVQEIGWQGYVKDGNMSGTTGLGYRVEALNINLLNAPQNAKIVYRTHVENIGWQGWQQNGNMAGTSGMAYRIEAIEIMLENMDKYTVEYKVHIQDKGWTDWYRDGETAGTVGQRRRIEAIEIRLVPKKEKRSYKGIDVSQFNGSINWGLVKRDGVDFAFIRAGFRGYGSRGTLNEDTQFRLNMQGARQAGLPVGVYFVTQATNGEEAIQEANWVVERVKKYKIDYPIAIDIEAPKLESPSDIPRTQNLDKNTRTYLARLFCEVIQNAGYVPIIYCNVDWAYNYLNMSDLSAYDTWIASYRANDPGYNGKYSIWQYTSSGQTSGILGNVDRNICYKKYML